MTGRTTRMRFSALSLMVAIATLTASARAEDTLPNLAWMTGAAIQGKRPGDQIQFIFDQRFKFVQIVGQVG